MAQASWRDGEVSAPPAPSARAPGVLSRLQPPALGIYVVISAEPGLERGGSAPQGRLLLGAGDVPTLPSGCSDANCNRSAESAVQRG